MSDDRLSVWRSRHEVGHLSQADILASMRAEAYKAGMEPSDCQDDGTPNIYFRTRWAYNDDGTSYPIEDGYQMPVKEASE